MPLKCFFAPNLFSPSKWVVGLSKEILCTLAGQRATKLQALKVCTVRESNPGRPKSTDSVYESEKHSLEPKRSRDFFDRQL